MFPTTPDHFLASRCVPSTGYWGGWDGVAGYPLGDWQRWPADGTDGKKSCRQPCRQALNATIETTCNPLTALTAFSAAAAHNAGGDDKRVTVTTKKGCRHPRRHALTDELAMA